MRSDCDEWYIASHSERDRFPSVPVSFATAVFVEIDSGIKECCSSLNLSESATAVQFVIKKDGTIADVSVNGARDSEQRTLIADSIERLKVDNPKSTCLEELSQESMRVRLNLATGKLIDIYDDWHSAAHLRQYEWNEFRTYNPQLGGI